MCSGLSTGAQATEGSSLTSGLAALTQPFKLRLCRAGHEHQLRDYSSNVVLIEPLATVAAVEEFLWLRVYRAPGSGGDAHSPGDAGQGGSGAEAQAGAGPATEARSRGAEAAKEGNVRAGAFCRASVSCVNTAAHALPPVVCCLAFLCLCVPVELLHDHLCRSFSICM
jgi:E3 ubiquitin-protein ligase TRIP12